MCLQRPPMCAMTTIADAPDALMKAHERLNAVRAYLLRTFPGGRQHSDEMWDALGSTDGLFAAMEGLRTNIPEAKALQSIEDTEQRRRILEANGRLGQWVGDAAKRVNLKLKALEKWDRNPQ